MKMLGRQEFLQFYKKWSSDVIIKIAAAPPIFCHCLLALFVASLVSVCCLLGLGVCCLFPLPACLRACKCPSIAVIGRFTHSFVPSFLLFREELRSFFHNTFLRDFFLQAR
jgi:hypothetical protein